MFFPFFMAFGLLVSLLKLGEELAEGRGKLPFFLFFLLGGDCMDFLPGDVGTGWLPPAPQGWAALARASALREAGAKGLGLVGVSSSLLATLPCKGSACKEGVEIFHHSWQKSSHLAS